MTIGTRQHLKTWSQCAAFAILSSAVAAPAGAVEGGLGAYFLGTRDTLAGIVPPPGTYASLSYDFLKGDVEGLSVGGIPIVANSDVELNLVRLNITHAFSTQLFGGTPALNLTIPFADPSIAFTAVTGPLTGQSLKDAESGFGDLTLTGMIGWNTGNLHYSTGMSVYAPTGDYSTGTIDVADRSIDVLSVGKNVWSFQPFFAVTWLDPQNGLEFSGAASVLLSERNSATDYQTAPALNLEAAVVQRLPSGLGFGVTGYLYQQLADDSGSGASDTRAALGASSLKANVNGVGPMITYSGVTFFGNETSFKLKYVHEFGAKRRIESDVYTAVISMTF